MKAVPPHYLTNEWRVTIVTSAPDDTAPLENKPAPIWPDQLFSGALNTVDSVSIGSPVTIEHFL
ncbi:hypothetical protein OUZ56_002441 [Daphnia magna]|uniref:Uncharacterized protein n=1 Tax=Daphnia magna TaxID=35525 RepID=A0ABR0A5R6_9CRUS|nr:hypothetical protein OUZ56_002441 [Daphnia magna]